jgi:hypothetical protein
MNGSLGIAFMGVWQGVTMVSLKFHPGPPCLSSYALWTGHPWNGLLEMERTQVLSKFGIPRRRDLMTSWHDLLMSWPLGMTLQRHDPFPISHFTYIVVHLATRWRKNSCGAHIQLFHLHSGPFGHPMKEKWMRGPYTAISLIWRHDRMTSWHHDVMTAWRHDRLTSWLHDHMTSWPHELTTS